MAESDEIEQPDTRSPSERKPQSADKVRLDVLLVERDHFPSRNAAAAAIMAGDVLIGRGRTRASKAGQSVERDVLLDIEERQRFVSRGGMKLRNALDSLELDPTGAMALDAGASTGGFTDCLLQSGAKHVVAADVAYGELSWSLRSDERVTVLERCNVRSLTLDHLPYAPDLIVADLSFISLCKVLPALAQVAADECRLLLLVKPQFEVGRKLVGSGGVVRDESVRRSAVELVASCAVELGLSPIAACSSGLPGPKGNKEIVLELKKGASSAVRSPAELAFETPSL